jgi:hypothetical protein
MAEPLRVVLDVNVLVSGAMSDLHFLRRKYVPGGSPELEWSEDAPEAALLLKRVVRCQLFVSQQLLDEWQRVRNYPKFKASSSGRNRLARALTSSSRMRLSVRQLSKSMSVATRRTTIWLRWRRRPPRHFSLPTTQICSL